VRLLEFGSVVDVRKSLLVELGLSVLLLLQLFEVRFGGYVRYGPRSPSVGIVVLDCING
jgi:hypothetical protein